MSAWVTIFNQSPVNNAPYDGDRLPEQIWRWPTETWFQARVRYLRQRNKRAARATTARAR
jgi:hypothetical protein